MTAGHGWRPMVYEWILKDHIYIKFVLKKMQNKSVCYFRSVYYLKKNSS